MEQNQITSAVVSTDPEFRDLVRAQVLGSSRGITLAGEVTVPFSDIGTEQLEVLRQGNPELIFLDLESDPGTGIRFAQFLADQMPSRRFVAAGPTLTPELLMEAMRAGITEYLPKPVAPDALEAALHRLERRLGGGTAGKPRDSGKLIACFSAKGGAGSTTIATNLAIHLHRLTGKKTLLVDLDLELGEIAVFLNMQPRFNFVDMIRNFHRMDAGLLASYIERHETGVQLLSAPFHPERSEAVSGDAIRKILQFLKQHYDYVVVDTSKSFSPATLATFEQADEVHLITTVDLPSLRNIKRCMPVLERVSGGNSEKIRLVINRYHPDDVISLEDVEQTLGLKVFWRLANDYEAVIRSLNSGTPVILDANSRFTNDLKEMGSEIAGLRVEHKNGKRNRLSFRSLFSRNGAALSHE